MFDAIVKILTGETSAARLPEPDGRVALAALLVRAARADDDYAEVERQMIDRLLATRFAMTQEAAAALRSEAEAVEASAPDTVRFTRIVKDSVPLEERVEVIEALWQVILSDGAREAEEDGLMRLLSNLLGLTDVESGIARQKAAARS